MLVTSIVVLPALFAACFYDIKLRIIPNIVPVVIMLAGFINIGVSAFDSKNADVNILNLSAPYILGFLSAVIVCGVCRVITKDGLGMGDVKLISALGFLLGIDTFVRSMLVTSLIALAAGIAAVIFFKANRKTALPFAPFIAAGVLPVFILETVKEVIK